MVFVIPQDAFFGRGSATETLWVIGPSPGNRCGPLGGRFSVTEGRHGFVTPQTSGNGWKTAGEEIGPDAQGPTGLPWTGFRIGSEALFRKFFDELSAFFTQSLGNLDHHLDEFIPLSVSLEAGNTEAS
jgi:hypothetical protein